MTDPDLLIRGTKNKGGRVGLPWTHHYLFLTSVHFTHGIISHHTRNNRPFQRFFIIFKLVKLLILKVICWKLTKIEFLKVAWFCKRLYGGPHHTSVEHIKGKSRERWPVKNYSTAALVAFNEYTQWVINKRPFEFLIKIMAGNAPNEITVCQWPFRSIFQIWT